MYKAKYTCPICAKIILKMDKLETSEIGYLPGMVVSGILKDEERTELTLSIYYLYNSNS